MVASTSEFGAIRAAGEAAETDTVRQLLDTLSLADDRRRRIAARAVEMVERMRAERHRFGGIDQLLQEFSLSSREGVVLMCLAEALLRVPDNATLDRFIGDTIGDADWERHLNLGKPLFVNAATWMLMLTGSLVGRESDDAGESASQFSRMVTRLGRPVVREAMLAAMRVLGGQFILGGDIEDALTRATEDNEPGYRFSFDMLGESARGARDAARYFSAYATATDAIGQRLGGGDPVEAASISVKLSALHPRYEFAQRDRVLAELVPRLRDLAARAMRSGIGLTVDAEESERLELSLEIFAAVSSDPELAAWNGLGLAVQAYQKRALHVVDWLSALGRKHRRRIPVRLVKGAYWDSEIKRAQERGLATYPVFTRKASTDLSYLACAQRLLAASDVLFAQFATHNAHTVAAVLEMAGTRRDFEFQRLHGMGEPLYRQLVGADAALDLPCRIYAPVGDHEHLLAYLVRRLLENGANTSFVNRIADAAKPAAEVVADPVDSLRALASTPHTRIPLPPEMFLPERRNARSFDLNDRATTDHLLAAIDAATRRDWSAVALNGASSHQQAPRAVLDPADQRRVVGHVAESSPQNVDSAIAAATRAAPRWDATGPEERAACLERAADEIEQHYEPLIALCIREAGKTLPDALAEVREAVDFCRYYAARARDSLNTRLLPGPTGETNELQWHGRGLWAAISPWNFPLAIFTGQVAAALVAGNCVLAKPAEQTPLIAAQAVKLFYEAGIPADVLHFLPGDGESIGARLVADPRVDGVVFTGSAETALSINRQLAQRHGPIAALIAETGGQNAMIVDSTALPEQVVDDVLASAFRSAGQRCSALRVLFLQDDIAERVLSALCDATAELVIGDPARIETDIGPVIDQDALRRLHTHAEDMHRRARTLYAGSLSADCEHGTFFAPRIYQIQSLAEIPNEVFGPILHVIRYPAHALDQVLDALDATRFGLTLGIHTRIESKAREIQTRLRIGNTYVNRSMIGATVGVQPFGGECWSGTGPKAGGPHYLQRMAVERVLTINTSATGGNASLASLGD